MFVFLCDTRIMILWMFELHKKWLIDSESDFVREKKENKEDENYNIKVLNKLNSVDLTFKPKFNKKKKKRRGEEIKWYFSQTPLRLLLFRNLNSFRKYWWNKWNFIFCWQLCLLSLMNDLGEGNRMKSKEVNIV